MLLILVLIVAGNMASILEVDDDMGHTFIQVHPFPWMAVTFLFSFLKNYAVTIVLGSDPSWQWRWEVCLQFPSVNEAGNWPINLKCNSSVHLIQETVKQRRWPCDNDVGYVTVWTCTQKRRARCDKAYSRLFFIMGCSRLSVLVSRMHRTGFPSELSLY
jgi:hypothetical protein